MRKNHSFALRALRHKWIVSRKGWALFDCLKWGKWASISNLYRKLNPHFGVINGDWSVCKSCIASSGHNKLVSWLKWAGIMGLVEGGVPYFLPCTQEQRVWIRLCLAVVIHALLSFPLLNRMVYCLTKVSCSRQNIPVTSHRVLNAAIDKSKCLNVIFTVNQTEIILMRIGMGIW